MRMTLLARPQPGAVGAATGVLAWADCSLSIPPRVSPRKPEPPTRRMSRRVTPRWESQRSLPGWPGMQSIDMAGSFGRYGEADGALQLWFASQPTATPQFKGGTGRNFPNFELAVLYRCWRGSVNHLPKG